MRTSVSWSAASSAALGAPLGPVDAQDEIRLGAFAPLSGISADVGAQMRAGAEVALERLAEVRVGGRPHRVRLLWYDTEGKELLFVMDDEHNWTESSTLPQRMLPASMRD